MDLKEHGLRKRVAKSYSPNRERVYIGACTGLRTDNGPCLNRASNKWAYIALGQDKSGFRIGYAWF